MKRARVDVDLAKVLYEEGLLSCEMIGREMGVTRQAVYEALMKAGVDTRKRDRVVRCAGCGGGVVRSRARIRGVERVFCGDVCRREWTKRGDFQAERVGSRRAKEVIGAVLGENAWFVAHHVDGNPGNNDRENLWAFRTQGDHMMYHRGGVGVAFVLREGIWKEVRKEKA